MTYTQTYPLCTLQLHCTVHLCINYTSFPEENEKMKNVFCCPFQDEKLPIVLCGTKADLRQALGPGFKAIQIHCKPAILSSILLIISFLISVSFSSGAHPLYFAFTISYKYAITGLSVVPAFLVSLPICLSNFSSSVSGVCSLSKNLAVSFAVRFSVTIVNSGLNHEINLLSTFF